MYKILYTLVCSDKDLYCEQCILSMMSAKKNSPNAKISLLIDDVTKSCIEQSETKKQIFNLIDELVIVPRPQGFSGMETSRFLKTSMRNHVKGDFLFIDCDTIICDSLNDIVNTPFDFGAVLDQHMPFSKNTHFAIAEQHVTRIAKTKEVAQYENYFNSGVLWVRETAENLKLFEDWHNTWLESRKQKIKTDQPSLAFANYKNKFIIKELSGIWNSQVWFAANYLPKAKIIHYLASITDVTGGYNRFSITLPQKIRDGIALDHSDWELIQNARNAFPSPNAIITGSDFEIYRSSLCGILRSLYKKRKLFNLLEKSIYYIRVFRAKILLERN